MIDLIESQWNRQEYPQVYNSLLLIQSGQNMSLKQQNLSNPFTTDLLGISFFKGGSSVLADAYLIKGDLTLVEERFAYWYGVILQLADDIQDINEDLKNNHSTIMNLQSRIGYIDRLVENLLNMIDYFLSEIFPADSETRVALKEMTRETVQLLIFASIIKNKKMISRPMYKKVKQNSCFSRRAYSRVENNFYKQLEYLMK